MSDTAPQQHMIYKVREDDRSAYPDGALFRYVIVPKGVEPAGFYQAGERAIECGCLSSLFPASVEIKLA
jgi:hypothetical protein